MNEWQEFDDYMIYNEETKETVHWCTYGDNDEYFLSKGYDFEDDFLEELENSDYVLINEKIDQDNTLESLIERTK